MNILNGIRIYHAILAILSLLAYFTGEFGLIHAWLGYAVALVIIFRLLWTFSGNRQVGLMRFYPSFDGLNLNNIMTHPAITRMMILGIALSLLSVTFTGIAMDKGKAIGLANMEIITNAQARKDDDHRKGKGYLHKALEETHEFSANLMLLFVGLHVIYLILFKFSLVKFMLFIPMKDKDEND